ncbi:MAG: hypothetical protein U0U69_14520 [Acidimicrobiia bacterium]
MRAAFERQAERYGKDPETDLWAPRSERLDALVDLVTAAKPSNCGDRATTVVHVGWDTLARLLDGDHGDAYVDLPFAAGLAAETARAMACDGHLDVWVDNPYGATIGIGRTSPLWPSMARPQDPPPRQDLPLARMQQHDRTTHPPREALVPRRTNIDQGRVLPLQPPPPNQTQTRMEDPRRPRRHPHLHPPRRHHPRHQPTTTAPRHP